MRAAVLTSFDRTPEPGGFEEPVAGERGTAVIDVLAAGLNPIDRYLAAGILAAKPPLPSVVGKEAIGLLDGHRVYVDASVAPFGSMAERTLVRTGSAIDVPDGVDDDLAVCFGIAGLAAWLGLTWRGGLQEGETALVLGASGIVGQIAVQGARLLGAGRVIAAARNEEQLERARNELGADDVVRLGDESGEGDLTERFRVAARGSIDLVLDPIWGPVAVAALQALGPGGRLVQIGNSAGIDTPVPARAVRTHGRSILGHSNFDAPHRVKAAAFRTMCRHGAAGDLRVPVETVPLEAITEAWERQAASPHVKLVVRPGS